MTMRAFTRPVPPEIVECELTHLARQPIDHARAVQQHALYEDALRSQGCTVTRLPAPPHHPDSVFIEDTAVVLDQCAVIMRPGAASRRGETAGVAEALGTHRPVFHIEAPGTLDGGDVLRVGHRLFVGHSTRSNAEGVRQLADVVAQFGYAVKRVPVQGCLHLKSAASALPDGALLLDPRCVEAAAFDGLPSLRVHPTEPQAANVLVVGSVILVPASAPHTRSLLEAAGWWTTKVDASELAKAEAGLTCCSLLLET